MPFPSAAWSALALVAGLILPPQTMSEREVKPPSRWKELFDYTHLPPSNETLWEPLSRAQVTMEGAIELVKQTEKATIRTLNAELKPAPEGAFWHLEVFVGDESPKRVNLSIASSEPKVLKRLELRSITAAEQEIWTAFSKIRVPAEDCIEVAKKAVIGRKPTPRLDNVRARTLTISREAEGSLWELEVMGVGPPPKDKEKAKERADQENLRRYSVGVDLKNPVFRYMKLLDRFAGTPLRNKFVPTELENGMVLADLRPGEGEPLTADANVEVNYRLWLLDNTKLHDTWKSKLTETFKISEAPLEGMRQGMVGMKVGGRRKICMPYTMGFGEAGNQIAPPKAMVVCDIHVNRLADGPPADPAAVEPPEEPAGEETEDG